MQGKRPECVQGFLSLVVSSWWVLFIYTYCTIIGSHFGLIQMECNWIVAGRCYNLANLQKIHTVSEGRAERDLEAQHCWQWQEFLLLLIFCSNSIREHLHHNGMHGMVCFQFIGPGWYHGYSVQGDWTMPACGLPCPCIKRERERVYVYESTTHWHTASLEDHYLFSLSFCMEY